MRRFIFILVVLVIVLVAEFQFAQGGKKFVQVTSNKKSVSGMKVSIFGNDQDGEWIVGQTDENGVAEFGSGFWSSPWGDKELILAVQTNHEMEWEGVVRPTTSRVIAIPIDEDDK
jgi:hypothetical protein